MMDTVSEIPDDYFNEFIGQEIHVECKSWPERFARAEWGPAFAEKFTPGEVQNVKINRKSNSPVFTVYFPEVDQLVTKLDLDYILKYSLEVPQKYHFLKAEYILRLSRAAAKEALPTKIRDEKEYDNVSEAKEEDLRSTEKPCTAAIKVGEANEVSKPTKGTASTRKKKIVEADDEVKEDEMFDNSDIE
jgi:hypothetical protein